MTVEDEGREVRRASQTRERGGGPQGVWGRRRSSRDKTYLLAIAARPRQRSSTRSLTKMHARTAKYAHASSTTTNQMSRNVAGRIIQRVADAAEDVPMLSLDDLLDQ